MYASARSLFSRLYNNQYNSSSSSQNNINNNMTTTTTSSFAYDRLQALKSQERKLQRCYDYVGKARKDKQQQQHHHDVDVDAIAGIPPSPPESANSVVDSEQGAAAAVTHDTKVMIDEDCRSKMCKWFCEVADSCNIHRDTVASAICNLDRFLCTSVGQNAIFDKAQYQLAAMTSFYVAVKIEESMVMGLDVFTRLSRGAYCNEDFVGMEIQFLCALGWRLSTPTPHAFIECFMDLLLDRHNNDIINIDEVVRYNIVNTARYHADLVLCQYKSVDSLPSEIAVNAMIKAISKMEDDDDDNDSISSTEIKRNFINMIKPFMARRGSTVSAASTSTTTRASSSSSSTSNESNVEEDEEETKSTVTALTVDDNDEDDSDDSDSSVVSSSQEKCAVPVSNPGSPASIRLQQYNNNKP